MNYNYRELLSRYKDGSATEEEKKFVESEIEKHEALEEYLSGIMDSETIGEGFDDTTGVSEVPKYDEETATLKKSVNRRLRKVVLTSVAVVIFLFVGVFFVLSPLVSAMYYSPDKNTVGEADNDISFDVYAISELNMPGFNPSNVWVDRKGFGEYDVMYSYRNVFNDDMYNVQHRIRRSGIVSSYGSPILNPDVNANLFSSIRHPEAEVDIGGRKQAVLGHLKELNPISYVSAGIIFEEDLTMEELHELELRYPAIEFEWAGIRATAPEEEIRDLIGIGLLNSKGGSGLLGDKRIQNEYPAFFIMDWLVSPGAKENTDSHVVAQAYEHHCINLLEYVVHREEAVNVLEHKGRGKDELYRSALEYVRAQGVKTYGVLVFAEAEDLIKMIDEESIKGVDFNQALVSKRNIN